MAPLRLSPQRQPTEGEPASPLPWLVLLGAGALVVRVVYVLVVLRHYQPVSDALHYHTLAANIADGQGIVHEYPFGFTHATAWRPPLYPLLLGAVYAVTGPRLGAAEALNVALGAGVVVLIAVLAWRVVGWRAAMVAGVVAAVYPPLVFNDGPPLSEPLGLLLFVATLLFLAERRALWASVTSGLLVLTRPSGQFFVLVVAGWILLRLGWRHALRYGLAVVVVVSPWLVRNWVRLGAPVVVTSNGFNLSARYSPEARNSGEFVDAIFDPRFAPVRAGITNEVDLDAALRRYALRSLEDDPLQVLDVSLGNLGRLLEVTPSANEAPESIDGRNITLRRLTLPVVWAVLPAGALGLWVLRRRPRIGPLIPTAAVFPAVSLVSVTTPRLRAPLDVACCIGVGGLVEVARRRAARRVEPKSSS